MILYLFFFNYVNLPLLQNQIVSACLRHSIIIFCNLGLITKNLNRHHHSYVGDLKRIWIQQLILVILISGVNYYSNFKGCISTKHMKYYCYTVRRTNYDIIISCYTTYKSAMQHISPLNLSSFRWKFLRPNSEGMSLLIDVLQAIKRCYQNLSLRYQGHKESISRYE